MSLLNQVLKDLKQRQSAQAPSPVLNYTKYNESSRFGEAARKSIYFILVVIAIVVLIGLGYWQGAHQKAVIKTPVLTNNKVPAKNAPHYNPALLQNSMLEKLDGERVALNFQFDKDISQFVKQYFNTAQNILNIRIANAAAVVQSQLFTPLPAALRSAKTTTMADGQALIALQLQPGAQVEKVVLMGPQHALVRVVLRSPATSALGQMQKTEVPLSLEQQNNSEFQHALDLANNGKGFEAIELLQRLLERAPEYHAARQVLAMLQFESGQVPNAKKTLTEGLVLAPDYSPFAELLAHFLVAEGNKAQALTVLKKASPDMKQQPDYYAFIAGLEQQLEHNDVAAALYRNLVDMNPSNGTWWMGLGIALEKQGQNKAALTAYQKALHTGTLQPDLISYVSQRVKRIEG